MLTELSVDTGEVRVCRGTSILHAGAIGSCVVVTAFDPETGVGGMAHVMLPGTCPSSAPAIRAKYSTEALEDLMTWMSDAGALECRIHVCLVGGGSVLDDGHDGPGPDITMSLMELLASMGKAPVAMEVGGTQRRSCTLHVPSGRVTYTVGDSLPRTLWEKCEHEEPIEEGWKPGKVVVP